MITEEVIRITKEQKKRLDRLKIIPSEPYHEVIQRLLKDEGWK